MKAASVVFSHSSISRFSSPLIILILAFACGLTAGCGSGGSKSPGNSFSGDTTVVTLATSTANDQLSQFNVQFTSVTLTSKSGDKVTLLTMPANVEFIHLNGNAEPLATASIPQGVYTSATAVIPSATMVCVEQVPSMKDLWTVESIPSLPSQAAVSLPAPIAITGNTMVLALNLQIPAAANNSACIEPPTNVSYSISPTFSLTAVPLAASPTNSGNGKLTGLQGLVASVGSNDSTLNVAAADSDTCVPQTSQACGQGATNGPTWQIATGSATVFQGISNFSALAAGMPVNMDATVQSDGSLLATRIAVQNTRIKDLSVFNGPVIAVASSLSVADMHEQEEQGWLFGGAGPGDFNFNQATFQISGQLANLQSLPFAATFNAANFFPGQNILLSTNAVNYFVPGYTPAAILTLLPQTVNGTITAIDNDGGFDTYTVSLAPYDLFANLAVQPGQATLLNNPSSIVVYADSNTKMLGSSPPAVGSLMRFNGLVFNDHGTLKMDAAWANDGVAE